MSVLVLGVMVLTLGGCGPTPDEIAATALSSMPIAYGLALLALWGLHSLWRERLGPARLPGPAIASFGALLSGLALIAISSEDFDPDLFAPCVALISTVAIALTMLGGRLSLNRAPAKVTAVAPAIVVGCLAMPFLIGWLDEGSLEGLAIAGASLFVVVVGTYVATPLILVLLVETVWARARYRRDLPLGELALDDPALDDLPLDGLTLDDGRWM